VILDKRKIHHLDWYLVINGLLLFAVGLFNLLSAASSMSSEAYGFITKQFIAFVLGLAIILFILQYGYRAIATYSKWLYFTGLGSVILVLIIGMAAGGAKRWINIGFLSIQPSEFMKPILIVVLAYILHEKKKRNMPLGLKDIAFPLALTLVPTILIIKQPDLGTGIIVLLTSLAMLWFVGLKKSTYAALMTVALVLPPLAWRYVLKPYQKMRVYSFINIDADPSGFGYHAKQAMIAVGSGGFFGKGYMSGTQHKLQFIPEHHTDFIYTVIGEEWGFVGSIALFLLFVSFVNRCLKISQEAQDELGSIMGFGVAAMIFFQFAINILMAVHLAPVVGIPLPFISYGGSSLLSVLASIGLLLSVGMKRYMF
jgi:rod shape determining protein RodA